MVERRGRARLAGAAVALLLLTTGCADLAAEAAGAASPSSTSAQAPSAAPPSPRGVLPPPRPSSPPAPRPVAAPEPGTALALLGTLAVKGRAPKTGYDRAAFGPAWADTDRNGCDTRNDVLARDLTGVAYKPGTRDCVVMRGELAEPYTGRTMSFRKSDASAVHIDHVVALSDAWQKGAQGWGADKRLAFANDPLNLLAVDGPANSAKSDGDAATWLPPHKPFRCPMVARQVAVKAKYGLWIVPAERDAIARVLDTCPREPAPVGTHPTEASVAPVKPAPAPPPPAGGAKQYANCTELRKDYRGGVARHGAVNQGGRSRYVPHYDDALYAANTTSDRDKDGVACEV